MFIIPIPNQKLLTSVNAVSLCLFTHPACIAVYYVTLPGYTLFFRNEL